VTAEDLVRRVRANGGRVYRMIDPPKVFVLTNDEKLALGLEKIGAKGLGEYMRARATHGGIKEWDLWLNMIPVSGEQTVWEAAA
jgi:hypothetical protein